MINCVTCQIFTQNRYISGADHKVFKVSRVRIFLLCKVPFKCIPLYYWYAAFRLFKAGDTNPRKLNFVLWHPIAGLIFNPLNTNLNPIYHLLALVGAHHVFHVSRVRVKGPGVKWYVWPGQRCKDKEKKGENIKFINIRYRNNAVVHDNNCKWKNKINNLRIHI